MDDLTCDRFDELALDLVYEDGDPAARRAAEVHASRCERCGPALARLVEDREHARLPRLAVPEGLEARVLSAALDGDEAGDEGGLSPWRWLARFVSLAGSYAMRPQVAMAVLLMMMVGSSLLLLRARPAGPGAVRVTKEGAPHTDEAAPPAAAAPAAASAADVPAEAAREDAAYAAAMDDFKAKRWAEAVRGFDIVASGGGGNSGLAALYAARATRFASGCGAAIARFDAVASRYVGTPVAVEAMWDAAICYREVGNIEHARQLFSAMKRHASYRERAERELSTLDQRAEAAATAAAKPGDGKPAAGAGRPATGSPKAAPAAPAPASKVRIDAYLGPFARGRGRARRAAMKLYTKTGDDGTTGLYGGDRVAKDSARVDAYGTIDEANAAIGVALSSGLDPGSAEVLTAVLSDLFVVGAELACAPGKEHKLSMRLVDGDDAARLERAIDEAEAKLAPMKHFVLPGGAPQAAHLHLARTITRRAERAALAASREAPVRRDVLVYLNRLSDLLFALSRLENQRAGVGDVPWVPRT